MSENETPALPTDTTDTTPETSETEAQQNERKKRSPSKKFITPQEVVAAAIDAEKRLDDLLVDVAAIRRSLPDIHESLSTDASQVEMLKKENDELRAKLAKLKEAFEA